VYETQYGTIQQPPCRNLHIYMIRGSIPVEAEVGFGSGFLGCWLEEDTSFLFFSSPSQEKVEALIQRRAELEYLQDFFFTYEEWQGEGAFKPIEIADFLIVPFWEKPKSDERKRVIVLDPGVVFGNGLHPTTRDCLKALTYLQKRCPLPKALDLGTGTGILASAAALLGAEHVLAVDLNPLCVKTAKKNVALNGLQEHVEVVEGRAEEFAGISAELAVANLHYDVIKDLLEMKGFLEKKWLILSGLMRSQLPEFKRTLARSYFEVSQEWDHEMTWFTILAENTLAGQCTKKERR
jgi:ribosomal protein L11 methyltransferase